MRASELRGALLMQDERRMTITGCARDIMERAQKSSRKAAKDRKNKKIQLRQA